MRLRARWSAAWTQRCAQHFRPEFLNRVDEIVVFHALTREEMRRDRRPPGRGPEEAARRARDRAELTAAARDALADEGYDPHFGARPLKRTSSAWSRTRWR